MGIKKIVALHARSRFEDRLDDYLQPLIHAGLFKDLLTIQYGDKRIERNHSDFDADTPFPIGSFTKVFVALAVR